VKRSFLSPAKIPTKCLLLLHIPPPLNRSLELRRRSMNSPREIYIYKKEEEFTNL